jgi:hypothetical protein
VRLRRCQSMRQLRGSRRFMDREREAG